MFVNVFLKTEFIRLTIKLFEIEIELPADKSKCSGSDNTNQDHEENQDHLNVSGSTPLTSRSTPAQDKVTTEIDQMTKK